MSDEVAEVHEIAGLSRRSMIKRAAAGAAIAWTAPALLQVTSAASASPIAATCDSCDVNTVCNDIRACNGVPNSFPDGCNCWVRADGSGCFCGPLDYCSDHQACVSTADCPTGYTCITNCCGSLCYAPCGIAPAGATAAEVAANPAAYGLASR